MMMFMMMFVRKFHFFHNFTILLVLYIPEHSFLFLFRLQNYEKVSATWLQKLLILLDYIQYVQKLLIVTNPKDNCY